MFKFFKNKRYYYKTWTGEEFSKEILVYGKLYKVKIYPNEVRRRRGWLDVEDVYMEYFIRQEDFDKGWHIQADSYTTALMKLTRHLTEEGDYVY
ncbi:hypothetical protein BI001_gp175 [Bacillus phage Zuko]|uniref:hypothetical protein n=1 Tax=Bacillus phage Zuko TaxID=1805956 RepID=UPI0007A76D08|nr:hypothetical protein BI001_gp175 [Bacillus phage Zuko]AMW62364.1 hypothetical protein ZUKO_203 [Bacillus phage Zuko]